MGYDFGVPIPYRVSASVERGSKLDAVLTCQRSDQRPWPRDGPLPWLGALPWLLPPDDPRGAEPPKLPPLWLPPPDDPLEDLPPTIGCRMSRGGREDARDDPLGYEGGE